MKPFRLDSIHVKFCSLTDHKTMIKIKPCINCKEIPLPQYRSYKSQDKVYCKNCYFLLKFNPDHLFYPTEVEYDLLEDLVINCINENCDKTFDIYSLEDFMSHQSDCKSVFKNFQNQCKKCNVFYRKTEYHDCYSTIFKNLTDLINRQDELESDTTEAIDSNQEKMEKRINDLENIVMNQNKSIESLKQIVSKLECNMNNLGFTSSTPGNQIRVNYPTDYNCNKIRRDEMDNENKMRIFKDNKQSSVPYKDSNENINNNQFHLNEGKNSTYNIDQSITPIDIIQDYNSNSIKSNPRRPVNAGETLKKEESFLNNSTSVKQTPKMINKVKKPYDMIITLVGHEKTVKSLIQLSDFSIASGSYDKSIKFWDLNRYDDPLTFNSYSNDIYSLAEICEGRIAFASGNSIKIFDIKNQKILYELKNHKKYINSVINIGKNMLASASKDSSIRIWDLTTSKCIQTFIGCGEYFNSVIQLQDGGLASCSSNYNDNSIKIWDLKSGKSSGLPSKLEGEINSICQKNDGRLVSGSNNGMVKVWDIKMQNSCLSTAGHNKCVWSVINVNEETFASSSSDKSIKIWDNQLQCVQTLNGHSDNVFTMTVLKDGKIASGSKDATIKIWGN
jgi:WD40 repeat protein